MAGVYMNVNARATPGMIGPEKALKLKVNQMRDALAEGAGLLETAFNMQHERSTLGPHGCITNTDPR
jgi:hypothetical protein